MYSVFWVLIAGRRKDQNLVWVLKKKCISFSESDVSDVVIFFNAKKKLVQVTVIIEVLRKALISTPFKVKLLNDTRAIKVFLTGVSAALVRKSSIALVS